MPNVREKGRFPNRLREFREQALLTREELSERTRKLSVENPAENSRISKDTIKALELGHTRPRQRTARTIATALDLSPELIWLSGIDTGLRNLEGITGPKPNPSPKLQES